MFARVGSLLHVPLLNKDQEQHLFRKKNYLKYQAAKLRLKLCKKPDPEKSRGTLELDPPGSRPGVEEIEITPFRNDQGQGVADRGHMRLVVNIAKRHSSATENFFELLSMATCRSSVRWKNLTTAAASSSAPTQAGL